jgi:small subunit ribosomal protein S9
MVKKETVKKEKAIKKPEGKQQKKEEKAVISRYFEAKGGRKTAIAQVRLFTKQKEIIVNGKDYKNYFLYPPLQKEVIKPLELMNIGDKFGVSAKVRGGGVVAQAEAVRHGIARALTLFNPDFRKRLKRAGLLTRDPRMVERKKYGLKKARRAPQWAKR